MVKEVASKTNDLAGDGTTTATVLAQAIVKEGLKNVASGANPMDLKRGIDSAVSTITDELNKQAKQIGNSSEKIKQVASISANNDKTIVNNCSKKFHVSPFIEMECHYYFRVLKPSDKISVIIDQNDKDGKLLYASQDGKAKELNEKNLLFSFISHPLMTFKIIAAIHYEALKLWLKGIKVIKKKFKIKNNISIEEK